MHNERRSNSIDQSARFRNPVVDLGLCVFCVLFQNGRPPTLATVRATMQQLVGAWYIDNNASLFITFYREFHDLPSKNDNFLLEKWRFSADKRWISTRCADPDRRCYCGQWRSTKRKRATKRRDYHIRRVKSWATIMGFRLIDVNFDWKIMTLDRKIINFDKILMIPCWKWRVPIERRWSSYVFHMFFLKIDVAMLAAGPIIRALGRTALGPADEDQVKNDELCIKNEELCIENEECCI